MSLYGFTTGFAHWGRYSEHQKPRFGGTVWDTLGIGLGKASRIQCRYFGSVAAKSQRDPSFSTLNSDDISYFKEILGEKNVIQDEDRLVFANTDWMRKYKGSSQLLLLPRSTEEVRLSCLGVPDHHLGRVCYVPQLKMVDKGKPYNLGEKENYPKDIYSSLIENILARNKHTLIGHCFLK